MARNINEIFRNSENDNLNGHDTDDNSTEIEIPIPFGIVAGKWWGPRNKQPIIALHGWQDNAGTFDRLCPLLPSDISILALDLPGHGKSSHYPAGFQYRIYQDEILLLRRIISRYKWENVTLMGHSMGAGISFMYAAYFPDDVAKLICLDSITPKLFDLNDYVSRFAFYIDNHIKYENFKEPIFNEEDAIEMLMHAHNGSLTQQSAQIMLKRGMAPVPQRNGMFRFTRDLRLKLSVIVSFSVDQMLFFASKIKAEMLNIKAMDYVGSELRESTYMQIIDVLRKNAKRVVFEQVSGTHHLHLNTPEVISSIISDFLL